MNGNQLVAAQIAVAVQPQRYAAAPAEPCYELHAGRGGGEIPACKSLDEALMSDLVRWSHPNGKDASTKRGNVTKPTAFVPRARRDRASWPEKFLRGESKNHG